MRRLWPDPADDLDVDELVVADARPTPADRPWLLVNMITSLDGAITIDGRSGGLGRPADKALFHALRQVADVVMAGAGTVRAEGYGPARPSPSQRAARVARGLPEAPRIAVVTRSLDLDLTSTLFTAEGPRPLVLTCETAPADRRRATEEVADVVVAGDTSVDLRATMAALAAAGVERITCEGGPHLNADLLAADLVDEWACTLTPILVAGDEGRAAVGTVLSAPVSMRLDRLLEGDGLLLGRWVREGPTAALR
ncbi:MAG: pyrimidine reductase family protein [Acidimicrobiales bacterium]|nr:pyrimidine reductase family protein [Acidimicrobiales bacterium]